MPLIFWESHVCNQAKLRTLRSLVTGTQFSTQSTQNPATDSVYKIKLLIWLIHTKQIISLENFLMIDHHLKTWPLFKREFLSSVKSGWLSLTSQYKILVVTFIPESLDSWILPVLEQ